jgi:hypothetical protein
MMAINTLRDIGKARRDTPIMIIAGIATTSATFMAKITTKTTGMDMTTTMITVTGTATTSEHLPPARFAA